MILKQEVLPIAFENNNSSDDEFVVSLCNIEAYNAVTNPKLWPSNRLIILGESGSGKSHLAKIWSDKISARSFKEPFEQLYYNISSAIIVEDIDTLNNELEFFHLVNYCMQEGISLLMTARVLPNFKLRDLNSRLNATNKVLIKTPDDELIMILLRKYFIDNQIYVDREVFDYISSRIDRSFSKIADFVNLLNLMSLKHKRAITIPFVKGILENSNSWA